MASLHEIMTITLNPAIDVSMSVERVVPIHKLRCKDAQRDPGGGGINVARVLRRFGAKVTALYTAGGTIGQLFDQLVEQEGIDRLAVRIAGEMRENFTIDEDFTGQQFRFVLAGPQLSSDEWTRCIDILSTREVFPGYLVASGSLPPGAPDDFYVRVAQLAKARHSKFAVDTSGPALKAALEEGVYLVKPNRRELTELVGRPLDRMDELAEACHNIVKSQQASIVALTLGDQGALLTTRQGAWRAPALAINPVSAVGAGDSFLGGMIWSLGAGHGVEEAFRFGVASGSAALLTPGTELCLREDVERLLGDVTLQPV